MGYNLTILHPERESGHDLHLISGHLSTHLLETERIGVTMPGMPSSHSSAECQPGTTSIVRCSASAAPPPLNDPAVAGKCIAPLDAPDLTFAS